MKVLAATLGLFILSIFVLSDSMAQKANYTTPDGWTIGVGGGYAYQKSDLANSKGFGFDFVLGKQLYYKENAFLSVDWKFRLLGGRNTAYDHRMNPDATYSNIRYKFFSYDLELGLTLNRLRERTGIILTGFAGAGLTHGRTFTDLYNANGSLYDFSSIDPNSDSKLIYEDLVALSDGDFETSLVNKAALLPTAGIFLGYQLSRSLSLGLEYKTNFYLTEDNSFVGIDLDNKAISGSGIDRNNYVSLGIRWNFRGGSSRRGASTNSSYNGNNNYNGTNNNNTTETYTQVVRASVPHPVVNITEPSSDPYQTSSPNQSIRATINNVSGPGSISFFQNGFPVNIFTYNVNTKSFIANIRLREGENIFRIQATNQASTAEDQATITLDNPPVADIPAPLVTFTSPSGNQHTSSADRVEVSASVKNISSKEDIHLTLNGINTPFEYHAYSGLVKTSVQRTVEANNLFIEAFNESGSAQDQLTVHFIDSEETAPPSVRFIDPLYPIEVNNNRFPVNAATQNVFSRNDLDLKINGIRTENFSFNPDGVVSVNLLLAEGVNTIEITAYNEAGMAADRTSITYHPAMYIEPVYVEPVYHEPQVRIYPPVIHIIRPLTYPFRTYDGSEELHATVLNVYSKENIMLNVNGYSTRNFSYNNVTKELIARISLREGENVLTIHAENESGGDAKDLLFIKETRHCPPPVIRLLDPAGGQISTKQQSYTLRADVRNITNSNQVRLSVNGKAVAYSVNNNVLTSPLPLTRGLNSVSLKLVNECGEDNASASITYNPTVIVVPCNPPTVAFSLLEVNLKDASHELKGSVSGVKNKSDISLTIDGKANNGFQFIPSSGELKAKFKLLPGSHTIIVAVNNSCGTDNQGASVTVKEPCNPPTVAFTLHEVNGEDASHELRGRVSGVGNKANISLTIDGKANNGFQFVPSTGELSAKFKLSPGPHTIAVSVNNACGTDHLGTNVTVEEPCSPPTLSFTLTAVSREDASHELQGSVTGVNNKDGISLTLDGKAYSGFQFAPSSGKLSAKFKLTPGSHTFSVTVKNACGTDSQSASITMDEPCSPPTLNFTLNEVMREDASHELSGSVTGVKNKADISMILDGKAFNGFQFIPSTGELSAKFKLTSGSHTIAVSVINACGTDSKSANISLDEPCSPPTLSFTLNEVTREDATHELQGSVTGVKNKSDISLTLDGKAYNGFQFVPSTGALSAKFKLTPGSHTLAVSVNNDCGTDSQSASITLEEPCSPPTLTFTLTEVKREDASHELSGSVTGIKNKGDISLTLDGKAYNGFQFVPSTGELSAKFKLSPGQHTIAVSVNNACGTDTKSETVTIEEEEDEEETEECGIRINPGNSDWQFCLVTPSGTYSRENLTNSNFSYSGSASSIYFMPIGGGGAATVSGKPYAVKSGQYYLFSGNLNVTVSTSNPGAMGHWSVCITASKAPVSGNGNNRPKSPCEVDKNGKLKGASTNNETSDSTSTRSNSVSPIRTINRTNTRTNTGTNTRTNTGTNTRTNPGASTRTVTGTSTRTNPGSNKATNTRTNYRTDDKTKKSTDDRSVDSTSSKTNTRTTTSGSTSRIRR